jgi:hypothetical protein
MLQGTSNERTEEPVTGKSDFSEEEWKTVLEAPPSAGLIVIGSDRGGSIRESFSMAKAYTEARKEHGESELLDEIVSAKPEMDHTRYHSPEELKEGSLKHITDAVALLKEKATPEELDEYKKFIVALANRVAEAHKGITDTERSVIAEIEGALGS